MKTNQPKEWSLFVCVINIGEDFETVVHELRSYFGFFRLQRTFETMLRFYSYDGVTNYIKCGTGGLQGDSPEFMVFFLVTVHLWGRIFGKFPVTKGLVYPEDPRQGTHDSTRIQSCETFPRQRSRPSGNFR